MKFRAEDWLGSWINFESMIDSREPAMQQAWEEAEAMVSKIPPLAKMFGGSAKAFWKKTCATVTAENPVTLEGCLVEQEGSGLYAEWFGADKKSLGRYRYEVQSVLDKGLEGKPNYVFYAPDAPEDWPFRYVIAMEPLPERSARAQGGLMSHVHFQFASQREALTDGVKLTAPMWYPTLCDGAGSLLDRCNIVRSMHKLPVWEELPNK